MMRHLILTLTALCGATLAGGAAAQQPQPPLQLWHTANDANGCFVHTNHQVQGQLPVQMVGLNAPSPDSFGIMIGVHHEFDAPPGAGEVVFAGRTATVPSEKLQFGLQGDFNLHALIFEMPLENLPDLAEGEPFTLRLDGQDFVTLNPSEQGPAVAWLARCLRQARG